MVADAPLRDRSGSPDRGLSLWPRGVFFLPLNPLGAKLSTMFDRRVLGLPSALGPGPWTLGMLWASSQPRSAVRPFFRLWSSR